MKTLITATAFTVIAVAAPVLQAQVRVVESQPLGNNQSANSGEAGDASNLQAELFYQFQALQQEVLELRGMVEEQAHEIQRLKQQRMDDYLDLDRRIGELSRSGGGNLGESLPGSRSAGESGESGDRVSETQMYRDAYQLLRDREIEQSIDAFNAYLEAYPQGNFAGNSHYWLGEIYLLNEDLDAAQEWFEKLLRDFPDDRKRADAQYKLGRVYHQQGNDQRAQRLLEEVASGTSDAARLARQYLQDNF
ncbi:outer membrane protein assembly factor BamD [Marinimicrobium sp. C6131]|uniref:YbgF trimerization domain-containing protein n=1 Tax=Marinimicrobium sp. C6131 TaxID=3022676 RepID=UPI00223D9363|nr:YbgF trimerization domain-containing protein [Marinimicrobium sp. C6131]UZJ44937.1 outer membrane protein assembly factor BamD [Marinimicrobium sp. C6131]